MKVKIGLLCGLLLMPSHGLGAQFTPRDPLGENFFPIELVQRSGNEIGFTKEQNAMLRQRIQRVKGHLAELQQKLKRETEALSVLTKKERVDEAEVMGQLDTVLNVEREIKRTQLALLIQIKNQLTPDQQARLKEYKSGPLELQEKMRRFSEAFQKWRKEGRDLTSMEPARKEIEQMIRQKKFKEAELAVDRQLKLLAGRKR